MLSGRHFFQRGVIGEPTLRVAWVLREIAHQQPQALTPARRTQSCYGPPCASPLVLSCLAIAYCKLFLSVSCSILSFAVILFALLFFTNNKIVIAADSTVYCFVHARVMRRITVVQEPGPAPNYLAVNPFKTGLPFK